MNVTTTQTATNLTATTYYRAVLTSGSCAAANSATATVTVTALPTASISYAGTPFTTSQGAGQAVSLTGTSGGTYSSTAGLTIDASTGSLTPSSSTVGTYTVTYTIASAGGCNAVTATTSVVINSGVTTFYYDGSGSMATITNWGSSSDGSGTNPSSMTLGGITYYVNNNFTATPANDAAWTLGSGSKIVVGDGTNATNFSITSGNTITGSIDVSNNATLTIDATTVPTFGTLASGSTVKFSASGGAQTVPTGTYGNLEINNTSGVSAGGSLTVNGNLTLTAGAFTPGAALTITGNLVDNGGTFTHNSGTVTFTGSNASIGGTDIAETFYNVVVNKTAGQTLSTSGSMVTISCAGTFTQTQGNFTAPATLNITGASTLTTGTFTAPSGNLTCSDNFTNNGATFTHNSGTVIMSGASKTLGGSTANTFHNLTASGATTFGAAQTVNNTMALGAKVTLGTNNLTIGSSGVISGYDATNYIVTNSTGKVIQNGIGSGAALGKKTFPIGVSSASYTPIILDNTGTSDDFSVRVAEDRLANGTTGGASIMHAVDRTWFVEEGTPSGSNVEMTIQWNAGEELSYNGNAFNRLNCFISHYTGTWDRPTPGAALGSGPYTKSRTGITSFSPFSVEDPQALPITLIDFTTKAEGKKVRLDWETGSEENNDFFTIERSLDGKTFEKVFTKKGAGNSKVNQFYFGYDANPYTGISYYRLKQTDFDGKFAYSEIVSIKTVSEQVASELNLKVYPNPVSNQLIHVDLHAQNNATYTMCIINEIGQQIYTDIYDALVGNNSYEIHLPNVVPGMYLLEIKNNKDIVVEHVKLAIESQE